MAIDFPSSPLVNGTYTFGGRTWLWNGSAWDNVTTTLGPQGIQGVQGTTGLQGLQGTYTVSSTVPISPATGNTWLNTNTGRLYIYDGTSWFEPYNNLTGASGTNGVQGIQGTYGPATVLANLQPTSYVIAPTDNGKYIDITSGNVTIDTTTAFTSGQNVVIFNDSAIPMVIVSTGITLRFAATSSTGNRTLAAYGLATVLCYGTNLYVIAGSGLS